MSMLKPYQLLFSGNVSHQTSNNLRSVSSQKLLCTTNTSATNKTEYNQRGARSFHVKWTSSPLGEIDAARLTVFT